MVANGPQGDIVALVCYVRPLTREIKWSYELPWPFMIFGLIGLAALGWQLFNALCTMEIKMRGGGVIRRDERPTAFWLMVVIHFPMLAICTWLALSGLERVFAN